MAISSYSTTPASNTTISGIDISEGCAPSGINNAIRQLMADVATDVPNKSVATNYTAAQNFAQGADIVSATTTDIGAATGNYINITGTTTITGLGTIQAGTHRFVTFTGALTLTHNGTSLILPGAANITTVAGDTAIFVSLGAGNWRCIAYEPTTVTGTGGAVRATSPTLTTAVLGSSTATTQASNDSSTKLATTAFVNPANSQGASGYVKLPSGLILQWGVSTVTAGSTTTVTLPLTFPTAIFTVYGSVASAATTAAQFCTANTLSTSQVGLAINTGTQTIYWFAIGN